MPTRNVVITDHQAAFIEKLVAGGEYQNASEVLREGLRLVEEKRAVYNAKLDVLRAAAQAGIDSANRGEFETFETREALSSHLDALAEQAMVEAEAEMAAEQNQRLM